MIKYEDIRVGDRIRVKWMMGDILCAEKAMPAHREMGYRQRLVRAVRIALGRSR